MKKFKFIILLLAVFIIGLYLYNAADINVAASIKGHTNSPESSGSLGGFVFDKNSTVTVSYSSTVKEGTLLLYIENSNGDIVNEFPVNSNSSEKISFDANEKYSLNASYTDFVGKFHVKVKKN